MSMMNNIVFAILFVAASSLINAEEQLLGGGEMPYHVDNFTSLFDNSTDFDNSTEPSNITGSELPPVEPELCVLPTDLVGDWWATMWSGNVSVQNDQQVTITFEDGRRPMTFSCNSVDPASGYLIMAQEGDDVTALDEDTLFTCIKFERRNRNNFHIEINTARNALYDDQPVVAMTANRTVSRPGLVCNGEDILRGDLLREGHEKEGALGCPSLFHGVFNLTYTDTTSVLCPEGAEMTSCGQSKTVLFDYSQCNANDTDEVDWYKGNEEFLCVTGGHSYSTVFQLAHDNETTPFQCMRGYQDAVLLSDDFDGTLRPGGCGDTWYKAGKENSIDFLLSKSGDCGEEGYLMPSGPGRQEGDENAASSVGASTLLMTVFLSVVFLVISRGN